MANTTTGTAVDRFRAEYWTEFQRTNQFAKYAGKSENSIIQLVQDLTKGKGDQITVNNVQRLTNTAVLDDATLEGNEEALGNYGHQITVHQYRNAVRVPTMENLKSPIDLLQAGKTMLSLWDKALYRDQIIAAMLSPSLTNVAYASETEANKDAWAVANSDRVLFGELVGNYSGDHSVDLAKIDATNDKLDYGMVSLAKRIAKTADPHIRPVMTKEGHEFFVLFCNSRSYRDLKIDLASEHQSAHVRGDMNPYFKDPGAILVDGVLCVEVPEIGVIGTVGASSAVVGANFLCGAQAVGAAFAKMPSFATKTFDYGAQSAAAIACIRGIEKLYFNSKQNMVTVYAMAAADS